MLEGEGSPEVQGKYDTWAEFDLKITELIDKYKKEQYRSKGERGLAHPSARKIPVTDSIDGSSQHYYYEFNETNYGFYIHVRNATLAQGLDATNDHSKWLEVDTTAFLGMRVENVNDYAVRFTRKDLANKSQNEEVHLLINPYELIKISPLRPRADSKQRELDASIRTAEGSGPIPVWHPAQDFSDNLWRITKQAINGPTGT